MKIDERPCRACQSPLETVLDLGTLALSSFPDAETSLADLPRAPLDLCRCTACGLVQLRHTVEPDALFRKYWYHCIGASEKLFARVRGWGRLKDRDALVHDTADKILSKAYQIELPCITLDGSVVWRPILSREVSVQDTYVIEFHTGARVVASGNHRWPTVDHELHWGKEVTTAELKPGTRVALVNTLDRPKAAVDGDAIYGYDAGYLIGAYVAEGCKKSGGLLLTLHETKDAGMVERISEYVGGQLYEGVSLAAEPQKHTVALSLSGGVVNSIVDKFVLGYRAKGKRLAAAVWNQPLEFIRGIVDAWLDGDGHYEQDQERWRFIICRNADLVEDIALACRLLGYRIRYRLRHGGQRLGVPEESVPNQYAGWIRKDPARSRQHLELGALGCTSVKRVWKQKKPKRTWDVAVGGDELYMLGCGIVTHNSSVNETMRAELGDVVSDAIEHLGGLDSGDTVVDVGANDGTLLSAYPDTVWRVAFEPADNFREILRKRCEWLYDYFPGVFPLPARSVRVITSIACFYATDDPAAFVRAVDAALASDGIWVVQFQDLYQMLEATAFDNICCEHVFYPCLASVERLLAPLDLHIIDAQRRAINGGSLRLTIGRRWREVSSRVEVLRDAEAGCEDLAALATFAQRVCDIRVEIFSTLNERGDIVVDAYGGSTKGNTLLQLCKLGPRDIRQVWERSPEKWGRCTVTGIPIVSEDVGRASPPDVLLMLIWQFRDAIIKREAAYLKAGGRLLFPLPHVELV